MGLTDLFSTKNMLGLAAVGALVVWALGGFKDLGGLFNSKSGADDPSFLEKAKDFVGGFVPGLDND